MKYRDQLGAPGPVLVPSATSSERIPLRNDSGAQLYDLNAVRDWNARRPGSGRWRERTTIESLRATPIRVAVLRDAHAGNLVLDMADGRVLVESLVEAPRSRRKITGAVAELREVGALADPDGSGALALTEAGARLLTRFTH